MQAYTYEQLVEKTKQLYTAEADISDKVYLELNHYIGLYIVRYTLKMRKAGGIEQKPMTRALRTLRTARASINKLRDYTIHSNGLPKKPKKKATKKKTVTIGKKNVYVTPHPTPAERVKRNKALDKRLKKIKSKKTAKKLKSATNIKIDKTSWSLDERLVYAKTKVVPERYL